MSTIYGNPLLLGGGGIKLNIDYGTNPPSDTTKLWVPRATVPSSVEAKYEFKFGNEQLAVDNYNYIPVQENSMYGSCQVGDYIYHYYWQSNQVAYFQRYDMNSGTWEKLEPFTSSTNNSFTRTWQNSMLATEDKIYMFGGRYSSASYLTTVLEYDVSTNKITNISNAPFAMAYGVWVKAGNVAYGFACFQSGGYNRVAKYDFTTKETTEVSAEFTFDTTTTVPTMRQYYPFDAGNGVFYLLPLEQALSSNSTTPLLKVDLGAKTVAKYSTVSSLFPIQKWTSGSTTYNLTSFNFLGAGIAQVGSTGYIFGGLCYYDGTRPSPYIFKVDISPNGLTVNPLDVYLFSTYISSVFYRAAGILNNKIHIVQYYSQSTDASYRNNQTLTLYSPLDNNKLFLQTGFGNNKFNIVNDNKAKVEIAINNAFIGNSENKADETDAYLYSTNDSKWKNIKDGNEWYLKPTVSTTATSGVTYVSGLSGLAVTDITRFAEAISNNSSITNATSTIYVDFDSVHRKISIGDKIALALNGTNCTFDVIGFNHDTLTTSTAYGATTKTGKAGITFQMHDLFATYYPMNSSNTNSGGWKSSAMRTSTMATMKGYMPAAWQTALKTVNKVSGTGGGSSSGTETTSDDLFLLAEIEVFGSTTHSVSGEGTQYAYYKAGNSKMKNMGGSASYWFERSPYSGGEHDFCMVGKDGTAAHSNTTLYPGTAFAFCV